MVRLVVGGGRAAGFPPLQADDLSLNIDPITTPHVIGDIAAAPFRSARFVAVYFERVPYTAFTRGNVGALNESARLLQPGGQLTIETGRAAPVAHIQAGLQAAGFTQVQISGQYLLRITAIR